MNSCYLCNMLILSFARWSKERDSSYQITFSGPKLTNFEVLFGRNRHLFLFFCDSKDTLDGLLVLMLILWKVCLYLRWDMPCDAPALISVLTCHAIALLLQWTMSATHLSSVPFTSLFYQNGPYCLKFIFLTAFL